MRTSPQCSSIVRPWRRIALCAGFAPIVLLMAACDAPPAGREGPQTRPAEQRTEPSPADAGADTRADSHPPARALQEPTTPGAQPTTQPATTQPAATQPDAAAESGTTEFPEPPPTPKYISILKQFDPLRPASVDARIESGSRLVIDSRNVERIEIHRDELPLAPNRSIALMLDGQPFEWLAHSTVTRFERSENGVWSPLPR